MTVAVEEYPVCPRCGGYIPSNDRPGAYPGSWSRRFRDIEFDMPRELMTMVCAECGIEEAIFQLSGFDLSDEKWPVTTDNTRLRRHAPLPIRRFA
jgi:hypothetical protein